MNIKFTLTMFLFCCNLLVAGTPPVISLECNDNTHMIFSMNTEIITKTIACYGENENSVIPTIWNVMPKLPKGLTLKRGLGLNKSKLFLSGTPIGVSQWKRYTLTALNNGNKVKKLPPASISFDIIIRRAQKIYISHENKLKIFDFSNPQKIRTLSVGGFNQKMCFGDETFLSVCRLFDGIKITAINALSEEITEIDIETDFLHELSEIVFFDKHFYFTGKSYEGEAFLCKIFFDKKLKKITQKITFLGMYKNYHFPRIKVFDDHIFIFQLGEKKSTKLTFLSLITNKIIKEISTLNFHFMIITRNFIVSLNHKNNSIDFFNLDGLHHSIKIKHFNLSYSASMLFENGYFFVSVTDPIRGDHLILRIDPKGKEQESPFPVGYDPVLSFAYGDGYLAISTRGGWNIYDVGQKEIVYSNNNHIKSIIRYYDGHFLLQTNTKMLFYSTSYLLEEGYSPIEISLINSVSCFSKTTTSNYTIVLPLEVGDYSDQVVQILDSYNMSRVQVFDGNLAIMGNNYIAVANKNKLKIYSLQLNKLLHEYSSSFPIDNIASSGNRIIISSKNATHLEIIDSQTYEINKVNLDYFPFQLKCHKANISMLVKDKNDKFHVSIFNIDNLTEEIISLNKNIILGMDAKIIIAEKIIFVNPGGLPTRSFIINIENKSVRKSEYINVKYIGQNKYAFRNHNSIDIVEISPDWILIKKIKHVLSSNLFYNSMSYGNNCLALISDETLLLIDTMDFSRKTILLNGNSATNIQFNNDKFIVSLEYYADYSLVFIDSISRKLLGSIRAPSPFKK